MKEVEYLAKQESLGIIVGLGATPQEEIHLVKPAIEGVAAMTEQPAPAAQPSSATTTTPTTIDTTSTTTTPTTTSTASIAPVVTTIPPPLVTTTVTPPYVVSYMLAPVMTPIMEIVIIHNVESDSYQEEVELALKKIEPKKRKRMTPSSAKK
ncbi:uncharacterized protein LOC131857814 [Cryptomeria japonica]|uniref:uncharacterized protein LOC131857814 n=1 Tax=Cryptomeria japonica TaxID=3369 RepID=UPI0027D9FF56|nr:uncharacterized protein LOC131857814 [Cryptomeria japonica]